MSVGLRCAPRGRAPVSRPALLPCAARPPLGGRPRPPHPCGAAFSVVPAALFPPRGRPVRPSVAPSAPRWGGRGAAGGGRGAARGGGGGGRRLASLAADRPIVCWLVGGGAAVCSGWIRSPFALLSLFGSAPVPAGGSDGRLVAPGPAEILPCRK